MAPYLRSANVGDGRLDLRDVKQMDFSAAERERFALRRGDVLVSEGSASARAVGMASVWKEELPGDVCFQNTLLRFRGVPGVSDPGFVLQWCRWAYESGAFRDTASGTNIKHIGSTRAARMPVFLPSLAEQRRIVDVMAALDSQVNALAAEKKRLVVATARLREDLFARHDSLPRVPAGQKFDMLLGRQKSERQSVGDHVLPYLRAANITAGSLRLHDVQTMNFLPHEQTKYGLRRDDIVLVEGGSLGQAARWRGEIDGVVGFDKHVIRLRERTGVSTSEFALQWCHWTRQTGAFDAQATGITIKALGFGRASAMPVPDLTVLEQEALVAPLAAGDAHVREQESELARLRDFRSTLLISLMSQDIDIPESYDAILERSA